MIYFKKKTINILKKCEKDVSNVKSTLEYGNLDNATIYSNAVKDCINKVFELFNNLSNNFRINFTLYYYYLNSY